MTVQPNPIIPLPPGADPDDPNNWDWQDADSEYPAYRVVGRTISTLDDCDIRTLAVQYGDGTIAIDDQDGPRVYVGMSDYTAAEARALAAALSEAAVFAEDWAGTPAAPLSEVKAALIEAFNKYRNTPGNAGDYIRAAVDAISDAMEVLR